MTFSVRPLTGADAVAFRFVRLEALTRHPEAYGSVVADWQGQPLSAYVDRIESAVIFGLFTDKGLEGLLAYTRETGNAAHRAALNAAYVRETRRGSGAFAAMLEAALDQARADGVAQVELMVSVENAAAKAAYARAGFEVAAIWPRALCVEGRYVDEALMIRRMDD
ncbi:GNAT family N-acetyltransferase [Flavimaricola marinus]|uniref:Mycothiol acetyltransferase n=1 Tax=Flavimaricola marinus TaxID=1819565 RepID=A0A238LF24_9RHOB|nr:GNAT family N-acetyltransferase [Flavimaricola marinus]SMY08014.1 Mycothiol acetyltransferase [Flavimaricola marinus]